MSPDKELSLWSKAEAVFPWERHLSKEGGRPDGRDAGMLIPS